MRVEVGRNSLDSIRGLVSDVPGARYISVFVSMKPLRLLSMISTFFLNYELDFNPWQSASQEVLVVKNLPATAGDTEDASSIPGLGRSPGGRHGKPLQSSCLGNPMGRGAWWAIVHRISQIQT